MTLRPTIPCTLALLLVLFSCSDGRADMLAERAQQLKSLLDDLYNRTTLAQGTAADSESRDVPPGKCGTPLILEAMAMPEPYRTALGFTRNVSRYYDSDLKEAFDSPSGHFKIHYTSADTSFHYVGLSGYGDANSSGVNDYVEIVARVADSVWMHHVDQLGYHEPLSDGAYPWGSGSRYDIYVVKMDRNNYGFTQPDTTIVNGNQIQATSWMAVANDYRGYPHYQDSAIAALQVTVAHEFFHALQFWYDASEVCTDQACTVSKQNPYWLEMSCVWMEEETYDYVNDYYWYLPYYMGHVNSSLRTFGKGVGSWQDFFPYGAGIFPIFLNEKFGKDIIRKAWERCAAQPLANFLEGALQDAIAEVTDGTRSFPDVWAEYSRWLYFTGTRKPTFFEEGAKYPMIPTDTVVAERLEPYIRIYDTYPIDLNSTLDYRFFPDDLGVNYLDFRTATLDSLFSFAFVGEFDRQDPYRFEWRLSVMGYDRYKPAAPVWVDDSLYHNHSAVEIRDLESFTDIVIIPTMVNTNYFRPNHPYRFSVSDTSAIVEENEVKYGPSRIVFSGGQVVHPLTVMIQLVENADVDFNVFTVAGEKIYSETRPNFKFDPQPFTWSARNQDNELVASGVYIVQVRIGGSDQLFKVLVVR